MATQRALQYMNLNRSEGAGRRLSAQEARKFLLCSSAPSIVQPEEADELIDYVVDRSKFLQEITTFKMNTNEQDIRFLDMDGGILRLVDCGQPCEESVDISSTAKCLRTVFLDAKFFLCDSDIEDNIIGAELERKVLRMAADRMANEIEFFALMGNVNASYSKPSLISSEVLHRRDGFYRQLQFGNVLDANAIDPGNRALTFRKLNCLGRGIPEQYVDGQAAMRIWIPHVLKFDFVELHQGRETDLGDSAFCNGPRMCHGDSTIETLPLLPTDIQNCGCGSLPSANGTFMFMGDPKNFIWGVQREIQFERWREACAHRTWYIYSLRMDFLLLNEDATSMVDCMQPSSCGESACIPAALASKCHSCLNTGSCGEPDFSAIPQSSN